MLSEPGCYSRLLTQPALLSKLKAHGGHPTVEGKAPEEIADRQVSGRQVNTGSDRRCCGVQPLLCCVLLSHICCKVLVASTGFDRHARCVHTQPASGCGRMQIVYVLAEFWGHVAVVCSQKCEGPGVVHCVCPAPFVD